MQQQEKVVRQVFNTTTKHLALKVKHIIFKSHLKKHTQMNKIGFKMSYELKAEKKRARKSHVEEEMPMIIPGTAMAHTLEVSMKLQEFEDFITTAAFARMTKAKKRATLDSYRFLLTTLALIQPPSGGISEVAGMSSIGYM